MNKEHEFIAVSKHMQEIKKLAALLRSIKSNVLIYGEAGVGKSYVAQYILPDATIVDGRQLSEVKNALKNADEIIIENIEGISDLRILENEPKKIIGIAKNGMKSDISDKIFGMSIHLLPLADRPEDIEPLTRLFYHEARLIFQESQCSYDNVTRDISNNAHSLKASVFRSFVLSTLTHEEIETGLETFIYKNVLIDDGYREFLKIFDKALINAYFRHFKSQLMMANKMGINRNTLRKKILELDLRFDDE